MNSVARAAAAVVLIAACGTPRRPQLAMAFPDPSSLATRCWELRTVGWKEFFLPTGLRVRFDTSRAGERNSAWLLLHVESPDTGLTSRLKIARWAPYQAGDSLFAVIGDGFTGIELRLRIGTDAMSGRAHRFADAPHLRFGGPVSAAPSQC